MMFFDDDNYGVRKCLLKMLRTIPTCLTTDLDDEDKDYDQGHNLASAFSYYSGDGEDGNDQMPVSAEGILTLMPMITATMTKDLRSGGNRRISTLNARDRARPGDVKNSNCRSSLLLLKREGMKSKPSDLLKRK